VAAVDTSGTTVTVRAIGVGTATITAKTHNNITETCDVTVTADPAGITLNNTNLFLGTGETSTLIATVLPNSASQVVSWESTYPGRVEVDSGGVVSAKALGTATITATTGNGKTATCIVTVSPAEWGSGLPGPGDNDHYEEVDLKTVLGVYSVKDAIEELHKRLHNQGSRQPYLAGLKVGMYLDLTGGINYGGTSLSWNGTHQNLRIVIASFDQYKDEFNTQNHIKFVFKNIPIEKKVHVHSGISNEGGYPFTTDAELRPYLEGEFLNGLGAALGGLSYLYPVRRLLTTGKEGAWTSTNYTAGIFIDTEYEVFGENTYGPPETGLKQTAIYKATGVEVVNWIKKNKGNGASDWWLASPGSNSTTAFLYVDNGGNSKVSGSTTSGLVPAFCIE
jgi:hypothetical protein